MATKHILTALSAAMLIGTADIAAHAAGLTIGGGNGSAASVTLGNNTANVGINNTSGPLATVTNSGSATGNGSTTDADINLGNLNGGTAGSALASVDNNGNLLGDDSNTNATLDLGSLLSGLDIGDLGGIGGGLPGTGGGSGGGNGGGGAGGGAGAGGGVGGGVNGSGSGMSAVFASLNAGDQSALRARCRAVLADPTIYKADVVTFCRMVAKL
jgi:hypothetical protein